MSKLVRPYFFATLVIVYFLTVVGLPVYMHYCGGEVEEISYLVKSNNCCGDEGPADNGCCRDEGVVLSNKVDFTIKDYSPEFVKAITDLFYLLPDFRCPVSDTKIASATFIAASPPFQNSRLAEIVVMRI